jgi:hypothetical protein
MPLVGGNFGIPIGGGSTSTAQINKTSFAGMTLAQVQSYYTLLQTAYLDLTLGNKPITVSYEGKSVTYTVADANRLKELRDEAAQLLGYGRQRRALRPYFR